MPQCTPSVPPAGYANATCLEPHLECSAQLYPASWQSVHPLAPAMRQTWHQMPTDCTHFISTTILTLVIIVIPILQKGTLRHGELKCLPKVRQIQEADVGFIIRCGKPPNCFSLLFTRCSDLLVPVGTARFIYSVVVHGSRNETLPRKTTRAQPIITTKEILSWAVVLFIILSRCIMLVYHFK